MTDNQKRPSCDKPCCNGPEPSDDKPFLVVRWPDYGYTMREVMEILEKDPNALPDPARAPKDLRARLPGDD